MKHLRGVTVESQVEGERSKLSHFLTSVTPPSPIFLKPLPHLLHCTGPPTLLCSSVSSTSYSFFTLAPILRPSNPPTLIHCSSKRSLPLLQLPSPLLRLPAIIELCPFLTKHNMYLLLFTFALLFFPSCKITLLSPSPSLFNPHCFLFRPTPHIIGQSTVAPPNRVFWETLKIELPQQYLRNHMYVFDKLFSLYKFRKSWFTVR